MHLEILDSVTSAKSLLPYKVTRAGSGNQKLVVFGGRSSVSHLRNGIAGARSWGREGTQLWLWPEGRMASPDPCGGSRGKNDSDLFFPPLCPCTPPDRGGDETHRCQAPGYRAGRSRGWIWELTSMRVRGNPGPLPSRGHHCRPCL